MLLEDARGDGRGQGGKKVVAGAYGGSRALGGCWGRCEG